MVTVVVSHPVQYFSPLFDLLRSHNRIDLTVAYYNDAGARPAWDENFGLSVQWDVDLTNGHKHVFLTNGASPSNSERLAGIRKLSQLIRHSDVVVIHGYVTPEAVASIALCIAFSVPYLLRADTSSRAARRRPDPRYWWPRLTCRMSSGALSIGKRNARVMAELGCPQVFNAPFAADHARFCAIAEVVRLAPDSVRLEFNLPLGPPVVAFAGKFTEGKRTGDLIAALRRVDRPVHAFLIGDGPERMNLERAARDQPITFTGFLNQREMPRALACADVLVLPSSYEAWGMVINEALACGCVPVVSTAVGCAPDLVEGLGEIYPTGDVDRLARAVEHALDTAASPNCYTNLLRRLSLYDLEHCASQYETTLTKVSSRPRNRRSLQRVLRTTVGHLGLMRSATMRSRAFDEK